jgi:DnaJ like chaperone protein
MAWLPPTKSGRLKRLLRSAEEMKRAAPIFNSAKRDAANFEECAEQLAAVFKGDRKLLEDVLDGLFHIAKADEEVRP